MLAGAVAMKAVVVDTKGDVRPLTSTVDDTIASYRTMSGRFPPEFDRGDTRALPVPRNEHATSGRSTATW